MTVKECICHCECDCTDEDDFFQYTICDDCLEKCGWIDDASTADPA